MCEILSKLKKNTEIDLVGNLFVLVEIVVHAMRLQVVELQISQKLEQISKNGQRHGNLRIKLYQCLKFGWNRTRTEIGLVGKFIILV